MNPSHGPVTTNPRNPRYEISTPCITGPEKGLEIRYIHHGFKGVEPYQQQGDQ